MVWVSEAMTPPTEHNNNNNERDKMTIKPGTTICEVSLEAREVALFNRSFPCSDIPEMDCFFQFEKKTGDLVDMSEHLSGVENNSAISALCEEARVHVGF